MASQEREGADMATTEKLKLAGQALVFVLAVPSGTPAVSAQLPPAIQVDRLLQRAEREIADGNHATAAESLNGVEALQAEHDLALPAEFWFKKAQVSLKAGLYAEALAAATTYLVTAGQDGEHYLPALELLDAAEEGKSRAERADRSSMVEEQRSANCTGWGGTPYIEATTFRPSTVAEAAACLEAGGAHLRDDGGATLLHMAAANVDDPAVIRALLDAGLDLEARAWRGEELVLYARSRARELALIR